MTTTIGLQTDTLNPNNIRETLRSLTDRFTELSTIGHNLSSDDNELIANVGRIEDTIDGLKKQLSSLSKNVDDMDNLIESSQIELEDLCTEHNQMLTDNENLQTEMKEFKILGGFQSLGNRMSHTSVCLSLDDNEKERQLRDTVRDELLQSLDHLQEVRDTHTNQKLEFETEWEGLKADILRYREEESPYFEQLEHNQELIQARLQGIQNQRHESTQLDPDMIKSTIEYIEAEKEYRELKDRLVDTQFQVRDMQNEVDTLFTQKTTMWHQYASLEQNIVENTLIPDQEGGCILKHSVAHSNLPVRDEGRELEVSASCHRLNTVGLLKGHAQVNAFKPLTSIGLLRKSSKQTSVCMLKPVEIGAIRISTLASPVTVKCDSNFTKPESTTDAEPGIAPDELETNGSILEPENGVDKSTNEQKEAALEPEIAPDEPSSEHNELAPEPEIAPDEPSSEQAELAPEAETAPTQSSMLHHRGDVDGIHDTSILTKIRRRIGVTSTSNQNLNKKGMAATGSGSSFGFKASNIFKRR